jgi:hypothetical protein
MSPVQSQQLFPTSKVCAIAQAVIRRLPTAGPGSVPRSSRVAFVVDKVALGRVFV